MQLPKEIQQRIRYNNTNTGEPAAVPQFKRIVPLTSQCELCELPTPQTRVVQHTWETDTQTWLNHCGTCHKYEDPVTGDYNLTRTHCRAANAEHKNNK